MWLNQEVHKDDIEEANWIFEVSTMDSLKSDIVQTIDPIKTKQILEIED